MFTVQEMDVKVSIAGFFGRRGDRRMTNCQKNILLGFLSLILSPHA
jgi:hypothetical protein